MKLGKNSPALFASAVVLVFGAQAANATLTTDETATQDHTCAQDQYNNLGANGTLNCTAADLVVSATSDIQNNTVGSCPLGTQPMGGVDITLTVTSKQADRYNVGYFVGQDNNSPKSAGGLCSVVTFPTSSLDTNTNTQVTTAWYDNDGNACGDYRGSPGMGMDGPTTVNTIHGVKLTCTRDPTTGRLLVPYTFVYGNSSGQTCTGVDDVTAGTSAKCQSATVAVSNVFVTTNADPECGKTMQFDPAQNLVTMVITITNNSQDTNFQQAGDGTQFKDDLSTFGFTNITPSCTNTTGGATCPTDLAVNSDVVTGSIGTFPFPSSVEITITANATPGDQSSPINSVDLMTPPTVLAPVPPYTFDGSTGISTQVGACTAQTTLPVKLQSFDVK